MMMVAIFKLTNKKDDFKILLMLLLQVLRVAIFNPINTIMDSLIIIDVTHAIDYGPNIQAE